LYVETPLHAGSGAGLGVVDLPIQRERVTGYPLVQSSGIKGKLRAEASDSQQGKNDSSAWKDKIAAVFGPDVKASEHAGALAPCDARLLLFPVRSLLGIFAWTTSRDALARFVRDANAAGQSFSWAIEAPPDESTAFVADNSDLVDADRLVLEEFAFKAVVKPFVKQVANDLVENALPDSPEYQYWRDKLPRSLVVLPENAFRDFTQFSTEVVSRIRLDPKKKTVQQGALWTEEHLPADTLLYAPIYASRPRKSGALTPDDASGVLQFVKDLGLERVQLGGDETVGRGLVRLRWA